MSTQKTKSTTPHKGNQKKNVSAQTRLEPEDLSTVVRFMNNDRTFSRLMEDNPGGLYIAGGFPLCSLIGAPISDIDIFGKDRLLIMEAARIYGLYSPHHMMNPTKYTISVNGRIGKVQFVVKEIYPNAQECIDSFDFSICQAAIWYEDGEWKTVCSQQFYPDLKARRLRFINQERPNETPGASLWRAAKYTMRGFSLSRDDKLALLERFFQGYQQKNENQPESIDPMTRKSSE